MSSRVSLFGMEIDKLTLEQAARTVLQWSVQPASECRFVVTPNVDHAVMVQELPALRAAYREAHLVLADGWPIVAAARLLGLGLPERVAGSDLVPRVFSLASQPVSAYLLGALPGVADRARASIQSSWPHVRVCGTYSPPRGFEKDSQQCAEIVQKIREAAPDILVVGLGAPKQELWVHAHYRQLSAKVVLCVGATIDFLAGEKPRAPLWMRQYGLEWLHRMMMEPRRLVGRYAKDARIFPRLVWDEWRRRPART